MSAHLIIKGPDEIDQLQITVDACPRVNEIIVYSGLHFRVTEVRHAVTMNHVFIQVVRD